MDSFTLSDIIPASPHQIFHAWLTGAEHSAFTGSPATAEPMPGGRFTAWDGYIEGTTLEIEPGRRILQSWRTTEFPHDAENSLLEVLLVEVPDGTRVTLNHNRIPEGQGKNYLSGWKDLYFDALKRHFGGTPKAATPPVEAKAAAPKAAAPKAKSKKKVKAKARAAIRAKPKTKVKPKAKPKARPKLKAKGRVKQSRKPARKSAPRRPAKKRRR